MILGQVETQPVIGPWDQAKAAVFKVIGYEVHAPEVLAFHQSDAEIRVVSAPARTSKSYSAAAEVMAYVQQMETPVTMRCALVGVDYNTIKEFDYCWEWLVERKDLLRATGGRLGRHQRNPQNGNMLIEVLWQRRDADGLPTRVWIEGKSASNEKSLQGDEWSLVVLSEAAEHDEKIWKKYMGTRYWRAIFPTTPKPHAEWIRKMIEAGQRDASLGIHHFEYPPEANPHYNWKRYRQAEKLAAARSPTGKAEDDPYFQEQFLGHWVYYTGKVLPFDPSRHVIANSVIDPKLCKTFVSMDYGYDHPSGVLFWAVAPSGIHAIFDELKESRIDSLELIERIQEKVKAHGIRPAYYTGDPQRPEVASLLNRAGLPVYAMNKKLQRDRAAGHRRLVDMLSAGPVDGFPGLYVCERCTHTIDDWKNLRYKDNAPDEFSKSAILGEDDLYDAARYGAMTLAGPMEEPGPEDWIAKLRRERDREMRLAHPDAGMFYRWAATGRSPY